jgi:hypothetical protein
MGRTGQPTLAIGAAAVVVAAAGVGVALSRGHVPVAKAATTLSAADHARLVSPAGHTSPAHAGQQVPNGDVVRTGRNGSATLLTRGRAVYVASSAAVAVVNGARQQLRTGSVVIDATGGPGLNVEVAGDVLTVPDHCALTATRSVSTVVGSLAGTPTIANSSARHLEVPALAQAVFAGDAVPTVTSPLHLPADQRLRVMVARAAPALIDDDNRLDVLAHGIDTTGVASAGAIQAAWSAPTLTQPGVASLSERVLPIVLADATTGGSAESRYSHAVNWRTAGGSWGVVVERLGQHAAAVEKELQKLTPQRGGQIGQVTVQAATAPGLAGGPRGGNPGGHSNPGPAPSPAPTHTAPSRPTPRPAPSKSPVGHVVKTVTKTVHKVVGLLPKHVLPTPQPKRSGGLIGRLLGH